MKIAINCRSFLKRNVTGIGRYSLNLVKSLSVIDGDNTYLLYTPKALFDFKRRIPRIPAKNFITKCDYFNRGLSKTVGEVDIYHAPSPEDLSPVKNIKTIVTLHDLVFRTHPQSHTPQTIATFEAQMESVINHAAKIICISQSTKNDLIKFYHVPQERMACIYHGIDKNIFYSFSAVEKEQTKHLLKQKGIKDKFILFVGTLEPRKNLSNLLKAFKFLKEKGIFDGKLVVAGMKGWMQDDLNTQIQKLELKDDVCILGFVSDGELCSLYNLASCFVFPSFYEGFGFPIIEAFSCGAPVVTSNISSCAEIAGETALTVDPHDPEGIARAISRVLLDEILRDDLIRAGLQRASEFSFEKTARETLEVYKQVYALKV